MLGRSWSLFSLVRTPPRETVPYFASFELPRNVADPAADLLLDLPGLVLSHLLRTGDGTSKLFTYWSSADHFQCSRRELARRLNATQPLRGRVTRIATPPLPWWRRIAPSTLILSAAALLGALDALVNHFELGFARPHLLVKPEHERHELIEGQALNISAKVLNQLPTVSHRDVRVLARLEDAHGKRQDVHIDEAEFPVLIGGGSKDIRIGGIVPAAGDYTLKFHARAAAGWFMPMRDFDATQSVKVWPRDPHGRLRRVESGSSWGRFAGDIDVGYAAAQGLRCELALRGAPGLRYGGRINMQVPVSHDSWTSAGEGRRAVAMLIWATGAVAGKQRVIVEVDLIGPVGTDWAALPARAALSCQPRKEDADEA